MVYHTPKGNIEHAMRPHAKREHHTNAALHRLALRLVYRHRKAQLQVCNGNDTALLPANGGDGSGCLSIELETKIVANSGGGLDLDVHFGVELEFADATENDCCNKVFGVSVCNTAEELGCVAGKVALKAVTSFRLLC